MRKLIACFLLLSLCWFGFSLEAITEQKDPLSFENFNFEEDNAKLKFEFNELSGILRVTYVLEGFKFDQSEATITVRNLVRSFAQEKGYSKINVYPNEDRVRYFGKGATKAEFIRVYYLTRKELLYTEEK